MCLYLKVSAVVANGEDRVRLSTQVSRSNWQIDEYGTDLPEGLLEMNEVDIPL